ASRNAGVGCGSWPASGLFPFPDSGFPQPAANPPAATSMIRDAPGVARRRRQVLSAGHRESQVGIWVPNLTHEGGMRRRKALALRHLAPARRNLVERPTAPVVLRSVAPVHAPR